MGGFGARFGYPGEGARISDLYWPDPVAGIHAALAVMAGIERRDRTGQGAEFDVSHMEAMWCALGEGIVAAAQGRDVQRMGNREPGAARSGFAAAAEGRYVAYVVADERAVDAVDAVIAGGRGVDAGDLADAIRAAGGAAEVVLEALDVLADPRLSERFEVVDHPVTGPVRQLRGPFVIDGMPTATRRHAPRFDQDTDAVLAEAGIDAERRAALRAAKVIGGTLPPPAVFGL
jgi:crotonobetainyl-CoA:carnitine CoA-transferase CaiB-like acyl-CoA transferase